MKALFVYLALALAAFLPGSTAGTITGRVRAEGKPGTEIDPNCTTAGNYDSRAFKFVQRVDYSAMHDFVIYIKGPVGTNQVAPPENPVQIVTRKVAQHKATFIPHVLPVLKGTTVEWPNNDDIFHNVFSYSETQPFDLGLYKAPEVKRVTFDTIGRVDVFCSIHSSMNCVVLVLENPYFATTDDNGSYTLRNVPAGTYQLIAWHERLPYQRQEITVPATGEVKVDFTLGISGLPKL